MPLFMSDAEFARYSNDAAAVALAEKADDRIKMLMAEVETVKALLDASSITAEQTCSILEHKHLSLSSDFSDLQSQCAQLSSSLTEVEAREHRLLLQCSHKDGEVERLAVEVSDLHQSKRQLMELVEQKDLLLSENSASIKNYLDKIISLTDISAQKEARIREIEAELSRCKAASSRLTQEKELIQQHNIWLNDELKGKHESLIEMRKRHADLEGDLSSKLIDLEKQLNESSTSLNWHKERVRELELELCSCKDSAAANEERLLAEISTINKLVELYKESSEEWSRKAADLEGVVKALEMHLRQVEDDYNGRLDQEQLMRRFVEKEAQDLKVRLEKSEMEVESTRKKNELEILPLSCFSTERWMVSSNTTDIVDDNQRIISKVPLGISGTALAATLLRDGWSLAKIYAKYQEAVDALRHEQMGRKEAESVLQRVLCELEEKAEIILDERAEHERMAEAYSAINQKLQNANSEQLSLEKVVKELKADLKRHERDYILAQEEIGDLEKQVTVLLKECRDIQLRCGSNVRSFGDEEMTVMPLEEYMDSTLHKEIPEQLLTYKDINTLVEQNVHLRSLVRSLSTQMENKEMELKEKFEMALNKQTGEAASKVTAVLQRAEEQAHMIESLHNSVAMYKKLYEEHNLHSSSSNFACAIQGDHGTDFKSIIESSQEAAKRAQEQAAERVKYLEEELAKSRSKLILVQSERDKLALEADFAKEKLEGLLKETDYKKEEMNGVLARNVEFSQLIVDYQRKLRESSDSLHSADDAVQKLTMEISVLKQEKEMLSNAEKRASDEVRTLTDRVSRLQATLDTIQSAEEVHEELRSAERQKQEEYVQHIQREWAEGKKELHAEQDRVRMLTVDRDQSMKDAMRKVDELGKELADALRAVAAAETRAAVAEARLSNADKRMKSEDSKGLEVHPGDAIISLSTNQVAVELREAKEEMEKLKEEAKAYKEHMFQYKSISDVNETALKQMENVHESFRTEAENVKKSLEAKVSLLGERVCELESEVALKSEQVATVIAEKEESLAAVSEEITRLRDDNASKMAQIIALDAKVFSFEDKWKNEHERWRSAQANYERQVVLQSETIQELTRTSEALSLLQQEASELRRLADKQRTANDELKAKWEAEKSTLMDSRSDIDKKCQQLDEQNKILMDRFEAMHIKMAENDRNAVGGVDSMGDGNLQTVISYLRRSKEIAETEISLLKQEKLRLQSQLEGSLKAAENAQASLRAERASAKSILYTEAEFKALQLQIRELSLLRESNVQLREENKHNFLECQRLRDEAQKTLVECERISNLLEEKQMEVESLKNECELHRSEKDNLEKRICELLQRCESVDIEHYERLKDDAQHMQSKLIEKETRIEEMNGLASERLLRLSQLERNLESCRSQLSEKEKRVHDLLLTEEKQKKVITQLKRKVESLAKEKEERTRENQTLSKQLEELKQGYISLGDANLEAIMKEKEEKDTRIQTMEKTIERQREVLKKEKERRQKIEESIMDSHKRADEEKLKVSGELEKHRQAIKQISGEMEKLKHVVDSLPEGTSVVQLLSGNVLDDLVTSYVSAIEKFELVARSIANELSSHADTPDADVSTTASTASAQATMVIETSNAPLKVLEERGRLMVPKPGFETRKAGRKLVRPHLKAEQTQEVEMPEVEGSLNVGKPVLSKETESNLALAAQNPLRKRLASSASDVLEQSQYLGEGPSDVSVHVQKKSRGSDIPLDSAEGHSGSLMEDLFVMQAAEESVATLSDFPQESCKATLDTQSDEIQVMAENPEEDAALDEPAESLRKVDDTLDRPSGTETVVNDAQKNPIEQVHNLSGMDFSTDKEEGELIPETTEDESEGDLPHVVESPGIGEGKPEQPSTPVDSPHGGDDVEAEATSADIGDVTAATDVLREKVEDGEITEGAPEGSEKIAGGDGLGMGEAELSLDAPKSTGETAGGAPGEIVASTRSLSPRLPSEVEESRRASPISSTSTTINLLERAKERAAIRQAGAQPTQSVRGVGRTARGRGVRGRGGRVGRGQASGEQGPQSSKG